MSSVASALKINTGLGPKRRLVGVQAVFVGVALVSVALTQFARKVIVPDRVRVVLGDTGATPRSLRL